MIVTKYELGIKRYLHCKKYELKYSNSVEHYIFRDLNHLKNTNWEFSIFISISAIFIASLIKSPQSRLSSVFFTARTHSFSTFILKDDLVIH